jgi:hypothetical protein
LSTFATENRQGSLINLYELQTMFGKNGGHRIEESTVVYLDQKQV